MDDRRFHKPDNRPAIFFATIILTIQCAAQRFGTRGSQYRPGLIADLRDILQIVFVRLQQVFEPGQAGVDERISLFAGDTFDGSKLIHRIGHLFFKSLADDDFGLDVHLPTGEFGGEAGVLAALADGE